MYFSSLKTFPFFLYLDRPPGKKGTINKNNTTTMNLKDIPTFVNNTYAVRTRDEWTNIDPFLHQNGFCIVENVLSADRCEELKSMFKTYLRKA